MANRRAYFVAGGTGGHILPAISLGHFFKKKYGFKVSYISGKRHLDYKLYENENCLHLDTYALVGKSLDAILKSLIFNTLSFFQVLALFIKDRPVFVFGAGGYVCGPTLLAAKCLGVRVYILEQNSVVGLTNKILARISNIIFLNFKKTKGLPGGHHNKIKVFGNPVRQEFLEDMSKSEQNSRFKILITGGSLGAKRINDLIISFLENYNGSVELEVFHQVGRNKAEVKKINQLITYKQAEYISDMPREFRKADFIICRGGATTVTELRYAKTPCLIIPTPISIHRDRHQVYNGESLKSESSFPVFIHNEDELGEDNCRLLNQIIQDEVRRDKSLDSKWFEHKISDAREAISSEILKNLNS